MVRIVAGVEYQGTGYHGWQVQQDPVQRTVQATCEMALSRVGNHPIQVICAGRTDKGVHAVHQVIHFDTSVLRPMTAWVAGTNHYLPSDIRIVWAQSIEMDFHARHHAVARRYRYVLYHSAVAPALLKHRVTWCSYPLNLSQMIRAAEYLEGEHDFSAFRAADCQARTAVRRIDQLRLSRQGKFIFVEIQANAFLHHMVRNIVGVLWAIGRGQHPPVWADTVLKSRQRAHGGVTAPPDGLYLTHVFYPERYQLPPTQTGLFW